MPAARLGFRATSSCFHDGNSQLPNTCAEARLRWQAASTGRPGAAYVDLPSDVLMAAVEGHVSSHPRPAPASSPAAGPSRAGQAADSQAVAQAVEVLSKAHRRVVILKPGANRLPVRLP